MSKRRFVILTEDYSGDPVRAKTAACVLRYCPDEVVALLDSSQQGRTSGQLLGVGDAPIVGRLADAPSANALLIGIANPGGVLPAPWRAAILEAIQRGMDVYSGMHDFLADDERLAEAARQHQVRLVDIRNHRLQRIARCEGLREECLRIHTVGQDCSVGKMVTSLEITNALKQQGVDAKFAPTGQTGIVVEGDGYPIDCMVADFVSGAAEQLVLDHQAHDVLVIEGQGSLAHPSYSGVTLGLLHGCRPHGMVLCYEVGRKTALGLDHVPLPPLAKVIQLYETMAGVFQPSRVIGIAMNSRSLSRQAAGQEQARVADAFGLPVCDVVREGPGELVEAILQLKQERERTLSFNPRQEGDPQ